MSHDSCPRHPLNTFTETPDMTFVWQTKIGVALFWSMHMTHEERHELECLVQRAREAGRMMLADKLRAFLNDEDQFELSASEWIAAATNMIAR